MPELADGESVEVKGSGSAYYTLKNVGGVYSCSCPAWRNQSAGIERRTCKHLKAYRGADLELARVGNPGPRPAPAPRAPGEPAPAAEDKAVAPVLLAERWENDADLSGWWMSEKLDGVRAYWDGKTFVSRNGNRYYAPDWFVEKLPSTPLDGELWCGRKAFQKTTGIVRRQDKSDHWKQVRFLVFDAPGLKDPFERRMQFCQEFMKEHLPPFATWHPHERCNSVDHLKAELDRVNGLGGEGLMLRQPGSLYVAGRSSTLLKVKTFHDAEAVVIDHSAGTGRHQGRLGALIVKLPDGTRFNVGTGFSDKEREAPPPVGSVITFRYQELSDGGVPRFPSYVGLRAENAPAIVPAPVERPKTAVAVPAAPVRAPTPTSTAPASPLTPGVAKRFELDDGTSSKFWEIRVAGVEQYVSFGRIGTNGQTKLKTFGSEAEALRDAEKMIAEKTGKGYEPVEG